ncbi:uncharacterized protein LOC127863290 [Dreissena polymorpha]|uniref:Uncharacterized protein n=1 Tax=Dreissena polymorpha TaxID=45954 RepID=A0A9D3Y691_DREPO|nr:uncharacterized protein LOC127863290 [Dreissena polymorpha]KAH3692640.1 hypothetical protein DPMN_193794 [Dreissena polymorpha]
MDHKFAFLVILYILPASCGGNEYINRPPVKICTSSLECPAGFCCRDESGDLVKGEGCQQNSFGECIPDGTSVTGTCKRGPSKPDARCTDRCGCGKGHTCYRTVTGFCCPSTTCWEAKAAAKDKKYWDNCRPPKCLPPPSANPGK